VLFHEAFKADSEWRVAFAFHPQRQAVLLAAGGQSGVLKGGLMATTLEEMIQALPPEQQAEVSNRAAELIAEELTLQDLRQARSLTQERLADMLAVNQESVSRLEQRSDLLLSTLQSYIRGLGGSLHLVVEFPDRPAVRLKGLSELDGEEPS
jgi:DNA-binding XRE family transcriptional regulator